jgi:hypothetical protein
LPARNLAMSALQVELGNCVCARVHRRNEKPYARRTGFVHMKSALSMNAQTQLACVNRSTQERPPCNSANLAGSLILVSNGGCYMTAADRPAIRGSTR